MKKLKQTSDKIIIEFDLIEFDDLQDFFQDQKEAVNSTDKFTFELIQKLKSIELENSNSLNSNRLERVDYLIKENKKKLKRGFKI